MRARLLLLGVPVLLTACGAPRAAPRASRTTHSARNVRQLAPRHADSLGAVILAGDGALRAEVHADGPIEAAASDWRGGWYVAGRFTQIDGATAPALAHVSDAGTLEPMPQLPAVVSVWVHQPAYYGVAALAASERYVYVTRGQGDSTSFELLVLDARSGAIVRGPVRMPGEVPAVAADRSHMFLDGVAGLACVDEYDTTGGHLLARFAVHMLPEVGCVNDIVPAGRLVYLAGSLGIHHGLPGAGVARFTTRDGRLDTSWLNQPVPCRSCYGGAYAIALGDGRVFENPGVGGWSSWLAAVSQTTGKPIASWHPPRIPGAPAPLALDYAGTRLFITGAIQRSGPLGAGHGLMTLDAGTGALLPSWRPPSGLQPARPVASSGQVLLALDRARTGAHQG